eukprot:augustus_masked-scaffold_2-processed-gene-26.6-mRNA-1 protein AED:1.00 eAED:1.00 QI:0/-1/0/0/-1/1/1/0/829
MLEQKAVKEEFYYDNGKDCWDAEFGECFLELEKEQFNLDHSLAPVKECVSSETSTKWSSNQSFPRYEDNEFFMQPKYETFVDTPENYSYSHDKKISEASSNSVLTQQNSYGNLQSSENTISEKTNGINNIQPTDPQNMNRINSSNPNSTGSNLDLSFVYYDDFYFRESYQRNNKKGGKKHLRCFPCCSTPAHGSNTACQSPLIVRLHSSFDSDLSKLSAYAVFELDNTDLDETKKKDNETVFSVLSTIKVDETISRQALRQQIKTRKLPLNPVFEARRLKSVHSWIANKKHKLNNFSECGFVTEEDIADARTTFFEFKEKAWHYSWRGARRLKKIHHVLKICIFNETDAENNFQCIGIIKTPAFSIFSSRSAKTKAYNLRINPQANEAPIKNINSSLTTGSETAFLSNQQQLFHPTLPQVAPVFNQRTGISVSSGLSFGSNHHQNRPQIDEYANYSFPEQRTYNHFGAASLPAFSIPRKTLSLEQFHFQPQKQISSPQINPFYQSFLPQNTLDNSNFQQQQVFHSENREQPMMSSDYLTGIKRAYGGMSANQHNTLSPPKRHHPQTNDTDDKTGFNRFIQEYNPNCAPPKSVAETEEGFVDANVFYRKMLKADGVNDPKLNLVDPAGSSPSFLHTETPRKTELYTTNQAGNETVYPASRLEAQPVNREYKHYPVHIAEPVPACFLFTPFRVSILLIMCSFAFFSVFLVNVSQLASLPNPDVFYVPDICFNFGCIVAGDLTAQHHSCSEEIKAADDYGYCRFKYENVMEQREMAVVTIHEAQIGAIFCGISSFLFLIFGLLLFFGRRPSEGLHSGKNQGQVIELTKDHVT